MMPTIILDRFTEKEISSDTKKDQDEIEKVDGDLHLDIPEKFVFYLSWNSYILLDLTTLHKKLKILQIILKLSKYLKS